jgi:hypothetical protein
MITLLLVLIVIGVLWYVVENYIPMPPPMQTIVRVVFVVAVVLYVLSAFGVLRTTTIVP